MRVPDQQPHSAPASETGPAAVDTAAVLSVGQERLWFLDQFEPGDASYNIPLVLRFTGPLSPSALGAALDTVAGRHEALRSRFPAVDGRPYVVVDPPSPYRSTPAICGAVPIRTSPRASASSPIAPSIWRKGRCCGPRCSVPGRARTRSASWCTTSSPTAGLSASFVPNSPRTTPPTAWAVRRSRRSRRPIWLTRPRSAPGWTGPRPLRPSTTGVNCSAGQHRWRSPSSARAPRSRAAAAPTAHGCWAVWAPWWSPSPVHGASPRSW